MSDIRVKIIHDLTPYTCYFKDPYAKVLQSVRSCVLTTRPPVLFVRLMYSCEDFSNYKVVHTHLVTNIRNIPFRKEGLCRSCPTSVSPSCGSGVTCLAVR